MFIVDSFGPRGHREVCTTGAVGSVQRVPNAYAALAILSTHPRPATEQARVNVRAQLAEFLK